MYNKVLQEQTHCIFVPKKVVCSIYVFLYTSDKDFCDCILFIRIIHIDLYTWLEVLKLVFYDKGFGWRFWGF